MHFHILKDMKDVDLKYIASIKHIHATLLIVDNNHVFFFPNVNSLHSFVIISKNNNSSLFNVIS